MRLGIKRRENLSSHWRKKTCSDVLFQFLLPRMLVEMDEVHCLGDKEQEDRAFKSLFDSRHVKIKGPRCATSRWGSWEKAAEYWCPFWTRRLYLLANLLVSMSVAYAKIAGALSGGAKDAQLKAKDVAGESMAENRRRLQKMRDASVNTTHTAASTLANTFFRATTFMILSCLRVRTQTIAYYQRVLRDPEGSKRAHMELASGQGLSLCCSFFAPLRDASEMEKVGFIIHAKDPEYRGLTNESLDVSDNDDLAHLWWGLVFPWLQSVCVACPGMCSRIQASLRRFSATTTRLLKRIWQ